MAQDTSVQANISALLELSLQWHSSPSCFISLHWRMYLFSLDGDGCLPALWFIYEGTEDIALQDLCIKAEISMSAKGREHGKCLTGFADPGFDFLVTVAICCHPIDQVNFFSFLSAPGRKASYFDVDGEVKKVRLFGWERTLLGAVTIGWVSLFFLHSNQYVHGCPRVHWSHQFYALCTLKTVRVITVLLPDKVLWWHRTGCHFQILKLKFVTVQHFLQWWTENFLNVNVQKTHEVF